MALDRSAIGRRRSALAKALLIGVAAGSSLVVAGVIDRYAGWPILTATLGPTAYVFAAHPESAAARRRNAVIGHGVGLACALAALAAFGLWGESSEAFTGHVSLLQAFATALALAVTLVILELADAHHAPAAATVVLVTTGLVHPGRPLYALICGLALVILASPLMAAMTRGAAAKQGQSAGSRQR